MYTREGGGNPGTQLLDIVVRQAGAIAVVAVRGTVDSLNAEQLTHGLQAVLNDGGIRVVLDASAIEYMSSAGLRSLLITVNKSRELGGDLRLAALQPAVQRVLAITGFAGILQIFANADLAIASFEANA